MSALLNVPGTYRVKYPTGSLDVTVEGFSPNQIKEQLSTQFRELANAVVQVNGNEVTFTVPSGQKNG